MSAPMYNNRNLQSPGPNQGPTRPHYWGGEDSHPPYPRPGPPPSHYEMDPHGPKQPPEHGVYDNQRPPPYVRPPPIVHPEMNGPRHSPMSGPPGMPMEGPEPSRYGPMNQPPPHQMVNHNEHDPRYPPPTSYADNNHPRPVSRSGAPHHMSHQHHPSNSYPQQPPPLSPGARRGPIVQKVPINPVYIQQPPPQPYTTTHHHHHGPPPRQSQPQPGNPGPPPQGPPHPPMQMGPPALHPTQPGPMQQDYESNIPGPRVFSGANPQGAFPAAVNEGYRNMSTGTTGQVIF